MPNGRQKKNSNVSIIHKHEFAAVQFRLTWKTIGITAATLLAVDLLFISIHFFTTLPEGHTLASFPGAGILDISVPSTLPGVYLSLKLLFGSAIAAFVTCTFDPEERIPAFWYLAIIVLGYLAINEMTDFESTWAENVAVRLFGAHIGQNRGNLLSQGIPMAAFYISAIVELRARYKQALYVLLASSVTLTVGPFWPEIAIPIHNLILQTVLSPFIEPIAQETFQTIWRDGLTLINYTLVITGLAVALHGMQKKIVTYSWRYDK